MRVAKQDSFRQAAEAHTRSASPRICMPTWRNFTRRIFQCSLYEAQDVLFEVDDVDLICLDRNQHRTWGELFKKAWLINPLFGENPLYGDMSIKLKLANLGLKKIQLSKDYDVFIAVFNFFEDLPYISTIERWRNHCKISVCWIDEMWAASIPTYKHWLQALSQFDFVFLGSRGSVSALSQAINRPCYWLPGGIDALRFSPFPNPPARVIDVYSIGRRYEGIHDEMLKAAEQGELFYVHDTLANVARAEVYEHQQHRDLFANIAKRSRYFTVAAAKMDDLYETGGQVEIGYRYFEGAAAGTVMIGDAPDCEAYRELFGWPDVVTQIKPDGSDIMAVLSNLRSDPARLAAISRRNIKQTLLHHDWVYRWKQMFRIVGIEPSPRMAAREQQLKDMADSVTCALPLGSSPEIRPCD